MFRFHYILIIAFCCALPCSSPVTAGETEQFGILQGRIYLDAGVPYSGVEVTVTAGQDTFTFISGVGGYFMGVVPAGKISVSVGDVKKEVTIHAGEINSTELLAKIKGAILTVIYPDGSPADVTIKGALYRTTNGVIPNAASILPIAPGIFWLQDFPAGALGLSVVIAQSQGDAVYMTRQLWKITRDAIPYRITTTVSRLTKVSIPIIDHQGKLLVAQQMQGSMKFSQVGDDSFHQQPTWVEPLKDLTVSLNSLVTDLSGQLTFNVLPNESYELILACKDSTGPAIIFEMTADGTATVKPYKMTMTTRQRVTQTVYDETGKPAPNVDVTASYCWLSKVMLQHAKSDVHGVVIWHELPPTRVITWGKGIIPEVLSATQTNATALLPLPIPEPGKTFRFTITNPGDIRNSFSWQLMTPVRGQYKTEYRPGLVDYPPWWDWDGLSGVKLNLMVSTKTTPRCFIYLKDIYLPYIDIDTTASFPIALEANDVIDNPDQPPDQPVLP